MSDDDRYPTEENLERIKTWPHGGDYAELMDYVRGCWWMPSWGWKQDGRTYRLATGGWSGNEDLINAMSENAVFWSLCWLSARRGGGYDFKLPKPPC